MSKAKPIELKTGAITKEEYTKRKSMEDKMKGNKNISLTPPDYLDNRAKQIYINIVTSLPKEFLNNTDEYVISIVADSVAKMQECQEIIRKEGLLVEYTNTAGATNVDQNKAVLIYQKYCDVFKKYVGEIGLSPSARSKLAQMSIQSEKKEDPLLKALSDEDD